MAYTLGLGDMAPAQQQRLMTNTEIAGLFTRHPLIATQVAETKAAIIAGLYDWNWYDYAYQPWVWAIRFPGIIEPIGTQVQDSYYGLVTIQPARNGEIYFSAYSVTDLHTDVPTTGEGSYEPPPPPCGDWLSCLGGDIFGMVLLGGLLVGSIYLLSQNKGNARVAA